MALSNSQYDKIIRAYEELQLKNRHMLQERLQEVKKALPAYTILEKELAQLSAERAKRSIGDHTNAASQLTERILALRGQKKQILADAGYPADYLAPIYTCSDCHDTGYLENGQKCKCFQQAIIRLLYTDSNLDNLLESDGFSSFSFDYYSEKELPAIRLAVDTCRSFIENFDRTYENLLLYGSVGIGKTFLSNCIAKELMDGAHTVIYFSAMRLFELIASYKFSHTDKPAESNDIYQTVLTSDLLIIDDLGTDTPNAFFASQLFLILNERHLRRKSTIISTNLTLEKLLEQYSDRTFSRISGNYTLLKMEGQDIRIKKKMLLHAER